MRAREHTHTRKQRDLENAHFNPQLEAILGT